MRSITSRGRSVSRIIILVAIIFAVGGMLAPRISAEQPPAITYLVGLPGSVFGFAGDAKGNVYLGDLPIATSSRLPVHRT